MFTVHRLVLETFVGLRPKGCEARHLNGDPADNRLRNLCWGTRAENYVDRVKHGRATLGERNPAAKLTAVQVAEIRSSAETQRALSVRLGLSQATVSNIRTRKTWRHV